MNAQQEAVALWKFLEGRGFAPSVRSIGRALRDQGLKFRDQDLHGWLSQFREAAGKQREAKNEHAGSSGPQPGSGFARAVKVSLVSTKRKATALRQGAKAPMKQPALDLGADSVPEIDFDRRRLARPPGLPERFPEPIDELRELAIVFTRTFTYCTNPEKIKRHLKYYTDTLAVCRTKGVLVATAWQAFVDAVVAQEGRPLFMGLAKTAIAYLPNGRAWRNGPIGPRVDSCGCPLPDGVYLPRLGPRETAHWDGDMWLYGSSDDPASARR